jgi:hypothetical protein
MSVCLSDGLQHSSETHSNSSVMMWGRRMGCVAPLSMHLSE